MIRDQATDIEFAKKARIKGYFFRENDIFKFVKKSIS